MKLEVLPLDWIIFGFTALCLVAATVGTWPFKRKRPGLAKLVAIVGCVLGLLGLTANRVREIVQTRDAAREIALSNERAAKVLRKLEATERELAAATEQRDGLQDGLRQAREELQDARVCHPHPVGDQHIRTHQAEGREAAAVADGRKKARHKRTQGC